MTGPTSDHDADHGSWRRRERPLRLECRHEFPDYEALRTFLDRVGELSEQTGIYPNLGFGRTYVNMTLFADDTAGELTPEIRQFARRVEDLINPAENDEA